METNQVFAKLTDACERVLKSQGSAVSIETQTMTLDQFAEYAMDQIKKAEGEKGSPRAALARVMHLHQTIAVAKSAFGTAELESFDFAVFKGNSVAMSDIEDRFKGIEDSIKNLTDSLGKSKQDDSDKDDDADKKKAKDKQDGDDDDDENPFKDKDKKKAKGDGDDKSDPDDADKKKAKDKQDGDDDDMDKKKTKSDDDADKDDEDVDKAEFWPMDLAKSHKRSGDNDLYDWGRDPA